MNHPLNHESNLIVNWYNLSRELYYIWFWYILVRGWICIISARVDFKVISEKIVIVDLRCNLHAVKFGVNLLSQVLCFLNVICSDTWPCILVPKVSLIKLYQNLILLHSKQFRLYASWWFVFLRIQPERKPFIWIKREPVVSLVPKLCRMIWLRLRRMTLFWMILLQVDSIIIVFLSKTDHGTLLVAG